MYLVASSGFDSVKGPGSEFVGASQNIDEVHWKRPIHEELRAERRLGHALTEEIGTDEHKVLVDMKMLVRRTLRKPVEAKAPSDPGNDGQSNPAFVSRGFSMPRRPGGSIYL